MELLIHSALTHIIESAARISTRQKISSKSFIDFKNWELLKTPLEKCPSPKSLSPTVNLFKIWSFSGNYASNQVWKNPYPSCHLSKQILEIDFWKIFLPKTFIRLCLPAVIPSKGTPTSVLCWWSSRYNFKFFKIKTKDKLFSSRVQGQRLTEMETCFVQEWAPSLKAFNIKEPSKGNKDNNLWLTKTIISGVWRSWLKGTDAQLRMPRRWFQYCQECTKKCQFSRLLSRSNRSSVKSTTRKLCMNCWSTMPMSDQGALNPRTRNPSLLKLKGLSHNRIWIWSQVSTHNFYFGTIFQTRQRTWSRTICTIRWFRTCWTNIQPSPVCHVLRRLKITLLASLLLKSSLKAEMRSEPFWIRLSTLMSNKTLRKDWFCSSLKRKLLNTHSTLRITKLIKSGKLMKHLMGNVSRAHNASKIKLPEVCFSKEQEQAFQPLNLTNNYQHPKSSPVVSLILSHNQWNLKRLWVGYDTSLCYLHFKLNLFFFLQNRVVLTEILLMKI